MLSCAGRRTLGATTGGSAHLLCDNRRTLCAPQRRFRCGAGARYMHSYNVAPHPGERAAPTAASSVKYRGAPPRLPLPAWPPSASPRARPRLPRGLPCSRIDALRRPRSPCTALQGTGDYGDRKPPAPASGHLSIPGTPTPPRRTMRSDAPIAREEHRHDAAAQDPQGSP